MLALVALLTLTIIALQAVVLAAFLRLFARWRRVEGSTWRRALGAAVAISVINLGISLALFWLAELDLFTNAPLLLLVLVSLGPPLVVGLLVVKTTFHTGWPKALVVGWGSMFASSVVSLAIVYAMRAALVEAFVIPTGGMAMALIGQHVDLTCENCGYAWSAGVLRAPPGRVEFARMDACPQCAFTVTPTNTLDEKDGDRILVYKLSMPARWELGVFDTPEEHSEKYVKRLVGLPGETIEIAGGDLYADGKRLRKPPNAHDELWFLVHDTAFRPAQILQGTPRWTSEDGTDVWKQKDGGWLFENGGDLEDEIWFYGAIDDSLAYNPRRFALDSQTVNDIRLDCYFNRLEGAGFVVLRWGFGETAIDATCFADGRVTLTTQLARGAPMKQAEGAGFRPDHGQPLRFAVRDGVASLWQNGKELAQIEFDDRNSRELLEAYRDAPSRLAIVAKGCNAQIGRLVLFRDVYYRTMEDFGFGPQPISRAVLGDDEYFLLGDNSAASRDCRFLGPIKRGAIGGVVICRYWPPKRWHSFD